MAVPTMGPMGLTGQTIKGYELLELIGKGGFGAVYRAYQPSVRREVAIKVILPEYANNTEFIRRFEAEAQLIAHLEHLHIVPLYDYWRDPEGAFLVMRWLKGGSLRYALAMGPWPMNDVGRLVEQIASALAAAHRQGIVHRDLKPDNILLDEDKNAFLADFGIARDLGGTAGMNTLYAAEEQQGRLMGSPHYLSPEQIRLEPVSPQSDIYSMGIMLYEIITGRLPYEGLPLSTIITKHLHEPLPHLHDTHPDLPLALNRVIEKATAKNLENRYPNAMALNADFRRALVESGLEQDTRGQEFPEYSAREFEELARLGITEPIPEDLDIEPPNPYKGLRAFQEADAADFYGREALTDKLVNRLAAANGAESRFLSVVGPSGSGKSSVVKAGLLPKLRQNAIPGAADWFIVEMTPGSHPLEELEAALLRIAVNPPASLLPQLKEDERGLARAVKRVLPGGNSTSELALVIDQFEEVFTMVNDEAERSHFLNSLRAAAEDASSRMRIITTLRADFYDRPLLYGEFGELLHECTEAVLPMSREELERAVLEPAERAGLRLEVGLLPLIVTDVGEQPGALPLMQYALTELYERRDGRWLTMEAYRDIGGVFGALARRADEIYNQLDEAGKTAARQIFLRLVTLNEGTEDTRRRARLDELLSVQSGAGTIQKVIDLFGKYRLLTFDRDPATRTPTVEIAHEALIRSWLTLRGWLQDNRENLRVQRRLMSAAEEWLNAGQDASFLASGTRLDQFEVWSQETDLALTGTEADYLRASLIERDRQRAAEAERQAREAALERRSRRFFRALAVVLALATVGALILTGLAFGQRALAEQNAATATFAQGEAVVQADNAATAAAVALLNEAEARKLALASGAQLALNNDNTDLAILLALQANADGDMTGQAGRVLAEAAFAPGTRRVFSGHSERAVSAAYSTDGAMAVSGSFDHTAIIWDVATGGVMHQLEGHADWVWDAEFSPDGTRVVSASQDNTIIVWDVETGEQLWQGDDHEGAVRSAVFSPDGTMILSGAQDSSIILWDAATGEVIRRFTGSTSPVFDVTFAPSGFTALSGAEDGTITLWNAQSGEPLLRYGLEGSGHTSAVWSLAYLPDESGFLSGSDDSTMILWSFETGAPVRRYQGHSSRVTSLAISPDGERAVTGGEDNAVILWDVVTGAILDRFAGHTYLIYGVAFSPNGQQILTASWDTTLRLWDVDNGAQVRRFDGHEDVAVGVAYSADGAQALSASGDGTLILWNVATGEEIRRLEGHTAGVNAVTFSPDGRQALSGSDDLSLILWNLDTGQMVRRYGGEGSEDGHGDAVWAVAFSADGTMAASGSRDNTVILWDVATGEQIRRLFGHTFRVTGVEFSPDGTILASSGYDNLIIFWETQFGQEVRRLEGHSDWVRDIDFSPDGTTLLSAGADNTLILWDVATGVRLRTFEGHTAQVFSAAFSPDGRYAVSGAADSRVIVWDIAAGVEVRRFTAGVGDVRGVDFSPDGQYVLSGHEDSSVRLWQLLLDPAALRAWIDGNRYVRAFTCAERDLYRIEPLCATPTPVLGPGSV